MLWFQSKEDKTYLAHIGQMDLLSFLEDRNIGVCGSEQCMWPWDCMDSQQHKDWCMIYSCKPEWVGTLDQQSNQFQWVQLKWIAKIEANTQPKKQIKNLTDFVALNISLASEARLADANHCSQWKSVMDSALSIGYTRSYFKTRILASATEACLLAGTFSIRFASLINDRFWNWVELYSTGFASYYPLNYLLGVHATP